LSGMTDTEHSTTSDLNEEVIKWHLNQSIKRAACLTDSTGN